MSSDGYFDDDLDPAVLAQLDVIEAAHCPLPKQSIAHSPRGPASAQDDSFCDLSFDVDEAEMQRIDEFIEDTYDGNAVPVAHSRSRNSKTSGGTLQTTLFGNVLPKKPPPNKPNSKAGTSLQRTKSTPRNPFGQHAPKTKQWDQTVFAKSGLKRRKSKGKGKARNVDEEGEEEEGEDFEFDQFPAPFVSVGTPLPMKLVPDLLEAKHWIYPLNRPKRDYQFNIVKHCLFENTLVALPTGLGKTFIAGVVMLNYYRWFPEGKVVFVAPSKPLVAQQIEACHKTCGIPGSDAVELTGQNPRIMRARAWKEKRVFYMTPQTLVNDLVTENCDHRNIILVVIDEAHRGTGDYAYAQAIRFLMAKNPHFRVLALTATPGSTPDAVQSIIDSLHISHIELRDEDSLDLKEYVFKKNIKQHVIKMSEDIDKVKDLLGKLMQVDIKSLRDRGVLYGNGNPFTLHPYLPQATMQSLKRDQKWAYGPLARLSSLARAMGYLIEATMGMCYSYLQELACDKYDEDGGKKDGKAQKLRTDPKFKAVTAEIETQRSRGFSLHPKMETLKMLLIQHFGERIECSGDGSEGEQTRAMVFVTYRECVDEIVEMLNFEKPLIRATKFVGQGTDKQGKKGFGQKAQLEVINKFKAGEFNVLVATSVGEEGLDIGEIDLIVCYDAQKTPIRMLQRVGRTGRKREGHVHVLLSEGREEFNLDKAKATYKDVQKTITRGAQLELYGDVKRLLPDHMKPECLEKVMDIVEYVREDGRRKPSVSNNEHSPERVAKRKRNNDVARNIPPGASTGFVNVAELLVRGSKLKKRMTAKNFATAGEDDDTDMDIETGSILTHAVSSSAAVATPSKAHTRNAPTKKAPGTKKKITSRKIQPQPTSSQFTKKGIDDSDDMDIEQAVGFSRPSAAMTPSHGLNPEYCSPLPEILSARIELTSDDDDRLPLSASPPQSNRSCLASSTRSSSPSIRNLSNAPSDCKVVPGANALARGSTSPRVGSDSEEQSMAWLVDEDDDPDIEIIDSSPSAHKTRDPYSVIRDDSIEATENFVTRTLPFNSSKHAGSTHCGHAPGSDDRCSTTPQGEQSVELITSDPNRTSPQSGPTSPIWSLSSSPASNHRENGGNFDMSHRDLPGRSAISSPVPIPDDDSPDSSFPVRRGGKRRKLAADLTKLDSSPIAVAPLAKQRRRRQRIDSSPDQPPKARRRYPAAITPKYWVDMEAIHSGDDVSVGSSHGDEEIENESDRVFLQESPETQVSPSYDQTLAYRQSLMTQAPSNGNAPIFMSRPVRRGPFAGGNSNLRRRPSIYSSPVGEPDEYVLGSFVVDDDAEIS